MSRKPLDIAALEAYRDIADDVTESDFVPYACLFDESTLLTKNGELLQILKITGFSYESIVHEDHADLRGVIRNAVMSSIDSDDYAIWFTTIRRKKSLSPDGHFPDGFSKALHEAWTERNGWDRKYINELYVTIVRTAESASITSAKGFVQGLRASRDIAQRNAYLEDSASKLNAVMQQLLGKLQSFGVRRLTSVKREDGRYYGEHLEFLEKLINLEERPMPLVEIGLSDYLTSGEIAFADNAMEVRSAENERRFGAMLTVKEYKEASRHRIDDLLQLPCEFIATQCLIYVDAARVKEALREQHQLLQISGEADLAIKSELSSFLQDADSGALRYAEQQTTLFMIGRSVRELEASIAMMRDGLAAIGIVSVREDIRFEECYWAMLPANFMFLARRSFIHVNHSAGFANIQNFPAGNAAGCPWGPPVTVFYTAAGTPYFFNFHYGEAGHTLLVGPYGSGKSVLLHFLLSEARKYQSRLFYLDARGHASAFVRAIGGHYYDMQHCSAQGHHLSPLSLPDHPSNREFLALWLTTLLHPKGEGVDAPTLAACKQVVNAAYDGAAEARNLPSVLGALAQLQPQWAATLAKWHSGGSNMMLFDHAQEQVAPQAGIIGFNLSAFMQAPDLLVPMVSYLLHRITMTFDGSGAPAIIVLDEAWALLDNPMFAARAGGWLDYIASKNGVVIMTSEEVEQAAHYPYCRDLISRAVTQIYLPDEEPSEAYEEAFNLSEEECAYLEAMSVEYRHFMLKRRSETIIAELNLGGMDDFLAVLSGSAQPNAPQAAQAPQSDGMLAMHYGEEG